MNAIVQAAAMATPVQSMHTRDAGDGDLPALVTQMRSAIEGFAKKTAEADALILRMSAIMDKGELVPENLRSEVVAASEAAKKLAADVLDLQQRSVNNQSTDNRDGLSAVLSDNADYIAQAAAIQRSRGKLSVDLNLRNILTLAVLQADSKKVDHSTMVAREQPLTILDFINFIPTAESLISFVRESGYDIMADIAPEGTLKKESNLTFGLQDLKVVTVAHLIKASKQVLADIPMLEGYINGRLAYGVRYKLEALIVNGSAEFEGLLQVGNYELVNASVDDTYIDVISKAKGKAQESFIQPELVILNPADWGIIERLKDANGNYIMGNPAGSIQPVLWGLPVVASAAMPSGKYWVGNLSLGTQGFLREDVTVQMSTDDGDNFRYNLVTILAEMRATFGIGIPDACVSGNLE